MSQSSDNISLLVGMGFREEESQQALLSAQGNVDRAIDLLVNGFGQNDVQMLLQAAHFPDVPLNDAIRPLVAVTGGLAIGTDWDNFEDEGRINELFDRLSENSNFQQFALLANANPSDYHQLVSEYTQASPQIGELLLSRPELFARLFDRVVTRLGPEGISAFNTAYPQPHSNSNNSNGLRTSRSSDHQKEENEFTHQEEESIFRLCSLGFSRTDVAHAFRVCHNDESATANFLVEKFGK